MQKAMRAAAIAAILAITPIAAQAEGQAFIAVTAGPSNNHFKGNDDTAILAHYGIDASLHRDKNDLAYGITAGYRWQVDDVFSIGPEMGVIDLGRAKSKEYLTYPGYFTETEKDKISNAGVLLGVNAKWMIARRWSIGLRTGLLHVWTRTRISYEIQDVDYGSYGDRYKQTSNDTGYYGALNVGYDISRHFGVNVGYQHYHSTTQYGNSHASQRIGVWAAGAEYRF